MDYFGRDELKELLAVQDVPTASIYLETERSSGAEANRLRFRAALEQAEEELSASVSQDQVDQVLDPFRAYLNVEQDFWTYQADGLAAFASPEMHRMYRLPVSFEDLVVVAPTFHTRPLMEYLQAPDRYWVLSISQKEVRLWQGTRSGLTPVDLAGVPRSLQEALGYEFERDELQFHSPKQGGTPGGTGAIFHGHGVGQDDAKPELKRFFRKVDDGVRELLADEIGPVILAAVDYYHPLYHEVSRLENLTDEGVTGNVSNWDASRLHDSAWPVVRETVLEKIDGALQLWENAYSNGKGEADLASVARLAVAGRIRLLLTQHGRNVWGRFDRHTGEMEHIREGGEDPGPEAVDLLDEVAEVVMEKGGRSLILSEERMPTGTGVAAILR
ncbi:MAG: hypothetical protein Q8W44_01280 [Candidatus Palauibacterales bacterium]|nr:hypothetical protein [Candidatus Palauibacterales bacterium]